MWPALALAGVGLFVIGGVLWIAIDGYLKEKSYNEMLRRLIGESCE